MLNPRRYGKSPYEVVVVHGGPGAPGSVKPIAEFLSSFCGVLEPFQTKQNIKGQIEELKNVMANNANNAVTLIGWSWGAWLAYLVAARYPKLVKKLVLISSGPFEEEYAKRITETRISRLGFEDKMKAKQLLHNLKAKKNNDVEFGEYGTLMEKADSYDVETDHTHIKHIFQLNIYEHIWHEAAGLRKSGKLLREGNNIICPVIAIHGDYDPHPIEGVRVPLSKILKNFQFILLKNCGHTPWKERQAKAKFYTVLKDLILEK